MILVIDNYDSFTYNLVQLLTGGGIAVEVVRNDLDTAEGLLARARSLGAAGLLLSPGPGRPEDAGALVPLLESRPEIPILGVCLGHQAMAQAVGATIDRAPEPLHGKTSRVRHDGSGVFAGLPDPFEATRYHSLRVAEETLPEEYLPTAWSEDGVLMGMRHRELPWWGVQFHPESILTSAGPALVDNFLRLAGLEPKPRPETVRPQLPGAAADPIPTPNRATQPSEAPHAG